jgi:hypothetical protein
VPNPELPEEPRRDSGKVWIQLFEGEQWEASWQDERRHIEYYVPLT